LFRVSLHSTTRNKIIKGISTRLKTALDRLESRGQRIALFFRDDDVDEDELSLQTMLGLFIRYRTPLNLQIIPGRLTPAAIKAIAKIRHEEPDLFELNQHGWRHDNHERSGRKCEFGPSRRFDQQLADIERGRGVLEEAFGSAFSPVFTPPWNRCTSATYRALDQLGFQALSRIHSDLLAGDYNFREVSVTLDLYRWQGGAAMKSPNEFFDELIVQLEMLPRIGIMLHHKVMDEEAYELLALLLGELCLSRVIKFHTFQSLLTSE
jgi:Polysaccharide deacetylase